MQDQTDIAQTVGKWSLKRAAFYGFAFVGSLMLLLLVMLAPALPRGLEPILFLEVLACAALGALVFVAIAALRNVNTRNIDKTRQKSDDESE